MTIQNESKSTKFVLWSIVVFLAMAFIYIALPDSEEPTIKSKSKLKEVTLYNNQGAVINTYFTNDLDSFHGNFHFHDLTGRYYEIQGGTIVVKEIPEIEAKEIK